MTCFAVAGIASPRFASSQAVLTALLLPVFVACTQGATERGDDIVRIGADTPLGMSPAASSNSPAPPAASSAPPAPPPASASAVPSAPPSAAPSTAPSATQGAQATQCKAAAECAKSEAGPVCNTQTSQCVECVTEKDCGGMPCMAEQCQGMNPCAKDADCIAPAPICDPVAKTCVGCKEDKDCKEGDVCGSNHACKKAGSCALPDTNLCRTQSVSQLLGMQTLDGKGDDFCDISPFELNFANAAAGTKPELKQKAMVRIAWTPKNLAAYIEVDDSEIVTNSALDKLWDGDNIEMFVSPKAADLAGYFTGKSDGVQLVMTPPAGENTARAARLFWSKDGNSWSQKREELKEGFSSIKTEKGYAIELQLSWSSLGLAADQAAGGSIGFDLGLSTATAASLKMGDDGREGSALLFVGKAKDGAAHGCGSSEQAPWCNSTTWCTATLK